MKSLIQMTLGFMAVVFMMLTFAPSTLAELSRWTIDKDHTTIGFAVPHMVISKTKGKFLDYSGVIEMDAETTLFKTIEATIHSHSIFTDHQKRDEHLRSSDFFDATTFPTMTYTMTSYKKTGNTYTALGALTIKGITKEIPLIGTFNGIAQDPWGNTRAGFTAEGTINRQDFGMRFNKVLDRGGLLVGNEVQILLEVEVIQNKANQ